MFASIGRRLALWNAAVVVAVIALVGVATYVLLRQSLDDEADHALAERAEVARENWADVFSASHALPQATPMPEADVDDLNVDASDGNNEFEDDRHDDEAQDLVQSGDTLLFAVDTNGHLLANARGLPVPGLPDSSGVAAALAGKIDRRSIEIAGERIRVYTAPARNGEQIIGAVQAARSDREHQAELRLVAVTSLGGIGLGAIIAVPVGLSLARRAMRPIDAAFSRQRAFVADASHELRTPLTLIRATAEFVQRLPASSPALRAELGTLLDEVDATARLVDDLLLLARLDSHELPLRRRRVDLSTVVRDAATPMSPLAEAMGLTLTIDAPQGLEVDVDPDRIRQVVLILLDNAIAYTPATGTVRLTVDRHGSRGRVMVKDTGVGIPLAEQDRVFDRFYRVDLARSRATGGSGLGLAIGRSIVHTHQGEIGMASQPGQGTTVWFTLPLAQ